MALVNVGLSVWLTSHARGLRGYLKNRACTYGAFVWLPMAFYVPGVLRRIETRRSDMGPSSQMATQAVSSIEFVHTDGSPLPKGLHPHSLTSADASSIHTPSNGSAKAGRACRTTARDGESSRGAWRAGCAGGPADRDGILRWASQGATWRWKYLLNMPRCMRFVRPNVIVAARSICSSCGVELVAR